MLGRSIGHESVSGPQSGNYSGCRGRDVYGSTAAATLLSPRLAFTECLPYLGMGALAPLTGDVGGG